MSDREPRWGASEVPCLPGPEGAFCDLRVLRRQAPTPPMAKFSAGVAAVSASVSQPGARDMPIYSTLSQAPDYSNSKNMKCYSNSEF